MYNRVFENISLEEMTTLAQAVSRSLRAGDVVAFYGDLGAGKSTFCRTILQALDTTIRDVPSPTFTLVQTYPITTAEGRNFDVWHMDWYRVKEEKEVYELGVVEAFKDSVCLIEWAEKAEDILPPDTLYIALLGGGKPSRTVQITGDGWQERLEVFI